MHASKHTPSISVYPEGVATYGTIVYVSSDGGSTWTAAISVR